MISSERTAIFGFEPDIDDVINNTLPKSLNIPPLWTCDTATLLTKYKRNREGENHATSGRQLSTIRSAESCEIPTSTTTTSFSSKRVSSSRTLLKFKLSTLEEDDMNPRTDEESILRRLHRQSVPTIDLMPSIGLTDSKPHKCGTAKDGRRVKSANNQPDSVVIDICQNYAKSLKLLNVDVPRKTVSSDIISCNTANNRKVISSEQVKPTIKTRLSKSEAIQTDDEEQARRILNEMIEKYEDGHEIPLGEFEKIKPIMADVVFKKWFLSKLENSTTCKQNERVDEESRSNNISDNDLNKLRQRCLKPIPFDKWLKEKRDEQRRKEEDNLEQRLREQKVFENKLERLRAVVIESKKKERIRKKDVKVNSDKLKKDPEEDKSVEEKRKEANQYYETWLKKYKQMKIDVMEQKKKDEVAIKIKREEEKKEKMENNKKAFQFWKKEKMKHTLDANNNRMTKKSPMNMCSKERLKKKICYLDWLESVEEREMIESQYLADIAKNQSYEQKTAVWLP